MNTVGEQTVTHSRRTPTRARARAKPKKTAEPRLPSGWRGRFIDALSELGNVRAASERAGVSRRSAQRARKATGPIADRFRLEWEQAMEEAGERLEQEAFRRAVTGWGDTADLKYSDRLLELLLKAAKPEKYSERRRLEGPDGGPITWKGANEAFVDSEIIRLSAELAAGMGRPQDRPQDRAPTESVEP